MQVKAMAKTILPIDEINRFREILIAAYDQETKRFDADRDGCIDAVLEILILAYVYGTASANQQLGGAVEPNAEAAKKTIYRQYDGKNFADRVVEYFDIGDIEAIVRVADTDSHRAYCDGQFEAAKKSAQRKRLG